MVSALDLPKDHSFAYRKERWKAQGVEEPAHPRPHGCTGNRATSPQPSARPRPGCSPDGPLGPQEGQDPTILQGGAARYQGALSTSSSRGPEEAFSARPPAPGQEVTSRWDISKTALRSTTCPHCWLPSAPWGKPHGAWPRFLAPRALGVLFELIPLPRLSPWRGGLRRGSLLGSARDPCVLKHQLRGSVGSHLEQLCRQPEPGTLCPLMLCGNNRHLQKEPDGHHQCQAEELRPGGGRASPSSPTTTASLPQGFREP